MIIVWTICVLIFGLIFGIWIGSEFIEDDHDDTPITPEYLDRLQTFGKEKKGHYSDRWQFSIIDEKQPFRWSLNAFDETDGRIIHLKYLKDIGDLENTYKTITNEKLT